MTERPNYYQCGRKAFREGRELTDQEYSPGSLPWRDWRDGWFDERAVSEGLLPKEIVE